MALFKTDVLQTAEKLVQKGKIEAAIKEYKKVVAKNPSDTNTLNRVGDLYVRLRKHSDAVEYYMKTAERYALDGFYVKAIAVYKKVQRIDSGAMDVHGRLADLYAKQGLINDARSHLNQLADHYLRSNDTPAAISTYERIVELDRESPTPLLRLADLYREDGQPAKATEAYQSIATMMIQRAQVDHAIQVYERALNVDASDLDFISQAVLKIRDAGGVDKALDLVARAERMNPAASELRSLVTGPQRDPDSLLADDGLAPIEEVEKLTTEEFAPPRVGSGPLPSAPTSDATATGSEPQDLRDESTPSLIDPSSFTSSIDSSIEAPVGEPKLEIETPADDENDIPPPPEPFALGQRGGISAALEPDGPSDDVPGVPAVPDTGLSTGEPMASDGLQSESQTAADAPDELVGAEASTDDPFAAGEPLSSNEIDLGELDDIAADAVQLGDVDASGLPSDRDLDAAFDRQVDPGPVELPELPEAGADIGSGDDSEAQRELAAASTESAAPSGPTESTEPAESASGGLVEEKLSEAGVFRKYGLLDKALDRLNEVLAEQPDHLEALGQAIQVLVERGDEARASTKAETLHLLCAQQNERDRWVAIQELLESEGYQVEGDRVRTPGELAMASGAIGDMPAADPYDQVPPPGQEPAAPVEDVPDEADFSALASEPLELDADESHDMLDSKEISLEDTRAALESEESSADELAEVSKSNAPSWLDEPSSEESAQSEELFDDEEEFFDLAAELQDDLGTGLSELDESLPDNAAEQSLEEIVEGFKRGVAENISDEESDTHYNLGIAYREMMLLDEAINEFQISAKSSDYLIESCAMLGLCFKDKGLPDLAAKWYQRAVDAPELAEEQRVGMLFELAESLESSGDSEGARDRYTEVVAMSGNYRDAAARLARLGGPGAG